MNVVVNCVSEIKASLFHSKGVEIQCIGHFKLLFCLLRLDDCAKLQQYALEVRPQHIHVN